MATRPSLAVVNTQKRRASRKSAGRRSGGSPGLLLSHGYPKLVARLTRQLHAPPQAAGAGRSGAPASAADINRFRKELSRKLAPAGGQPA